jgi:hypothetical protein
MRKWDAQNIVQPFFYKNEINRFNFITIIS